MRYATATLIVFLAAFMLGCASESITPVSPNLINNASQASPSQGRMLWGIWKVAIDKGTRDVDIVPLRGAMFNCNVQQFLSPPFVPTNHMQIVLLPATDLAAGYVECEVSLTHPFLGLNVYKGFDVRGIFMADGSKVSDHDSAICYGSAETNEPYMLNPDGYTRWWNAMEFTDPMGLLSFKPGKMGTSKLPYATINPYKYFADGFSDEQDVATLDTATRGIFTPTSSPNSRIYRIQFPLVGGVPQFLFNYAVDASWDQPNPAYAPDYPLEAFGPGAQCQEAYNVSFNDEGSNAWFYSDQYGGKLVLNVQVFDWQGMTNPAGVPGEVKELWVESPVLASPLNILSFAVASPGGPTSSVFTAEISKPYLAPSAAGDFPLLGSVVSMSPDSYQPQLTGGEWFIYPDGPLAAYFMGTVTITGEAGLLHPVVTGIDPNKGDLDFSYDDVEVTGNYFLEGATIKLVKNDDPTVAIDATNVVFVDTTKLTCTIDLSTYTTPAKPGVYNVVVTNPDTGEGQLDNGFEVVSYGCAPNSWGDNFDSCSQGQYPAGWENFWSGVNAYATGEQYNSPPNSFRLEAYSSWARYDGHPFTSAGKTYVCYEVDVMLTDATRAARTGFAWKTTPSTTGHYATLGIGAPTFTQTYHWYHVLAKVDMANDKWYAWVDGQKIVDGTSPGNQQAHDSFTHYFVGIGNFSSGATGVVYYDNVWLYWK